MLAIMTAIIPATDKRGTRIKAYTCNGHKLIAPKDGNLGDVEAHFAVARRLIREQLKDAPDSRTMTYGGSETGYVFCWTISTITEAE